MKNLFSKIRRIRIHSKTKKNKNQKLANSQVLIKMRNNNYNKKNNKEEIKTQDQNKRKDKPKDNKKNSNKLMLKTMKILKINKVHLIIVIL